MNIFRLINLFRKTNGRSPTPSELAKLKQQAEEIATQDNVLQFPQGGKDRLSPFDDFKASEDAFEESMKPKGARPGNINYEAMQEKFPDVKLYGDESFQELLDIEKTGKHPRDKADGGRIGFSGGGGIDKMRRLILKLMGSGGAAAVAGKAGILGLKGKKTAKAVEDIKITMGNNFDADIHSDGTQYGITEAFQ